MPYKDPIEQKAALAAHYQANKGKYATSRRKSRAKRRATIDALRNKPCADCQLSFPVQVMQFHHLDPKTKVGEVGEMLHRVKMEEVIAETKKCVVLCANCHIIRHSKSIVA